MTNRHKRHKPSQCVTSAGHFAVTSVTHPFRGVTFVTLADLNGAYGNEASGSRQELEVDDA